MDDEIVAVSAALAEAQWQVTRWLTRRRALMVRAYRDGKTTRQIAELWGVSQPAVQGQLQAAAGRRSITALRDTPPKTAKGDPG